MNSDLEKLSAQLHKFAKPNPIELDKHLRTHRARLLKAKSVAGVKFEAAEGIRLLRVFFALLSSNSLPLTAGYIRRDSWLLLVQSRLEELRDGKSKVNFQPSIINFELGETDYLKMAKLIASSEPLPIPYRKQSVDRQGFVDTATLIASDPMRYSVWIKLTRPDDEIDSIPLASENQV